MGGRGGEVRMPHPRLLYNLPRRSGKKLPLLSPTARIGAVVCFVKTGNNVKWGKKIRFSESAQKICLVLYQTLCLLSLMKNHTQKRKLEVICALGSQKYASIPQKWF